MTPPGTRCFPGKKLHVLDPCERNGTRFPGVCFSGWNRGSEGRVRSGVRWNLFFPVYWFCDLWQVIEPSQSQFPICRMRIVTFTWHNLENFKTKQINVNRL